MGAFLIMTIIGCMAISGYQCWRLGKHQGIVGTITNLEASGLLEMDEE